MSGFKYVFVSIQRTLNARQQHLRESIDAALKTFSFVPMTVNNGADTYDPLPELRQLIPCCSGALIIAFERFRYKSGLEYPDSANEINHFDRRSATVWNQIEAAMAYQAGIPLLVLQEQGLQQEGIMDTHLPSVKMVEFRLRECAEGLPEAIRAVLNEWAQAIMR